MIELRGVTFAYRREPVLRDVSLEVPPGQMLGVIGPNSSGKSTLLRLAAGLLRPSGGLVLLSGQDLARTSRRRAAALASFVPQETPTFFPFRVLEVVLMGRGPHLPLVSFDSEKDVRIAREALEAAGIPHLEERFFDELSGGERQLVVIARALAQEAPVMLFDEPTTFLDMRHQVEVFDVVTRLNRERGRTVVIVSHDLNLAALHCDRLVLLGAGAIAADGAPEEVLCSPALPETYGVGIEVSASRSGRLSVMPQSGAGGRR